MTIAPYLKVWIRHCTKFGWLLTFFFTNKRDLFIEIQLTGSIVIPGRSSESLVLKENWWSVDPRTMAWCLLGLTIIPFSVHQVRPDTRFLPSALHAAYAVRLRDSAEIIVLGPYLCTQIWVGAIISLFKMPLSICQSRRKETRNALPVIRWVRWVPSSQNKDTSAASQTLLTAVKLRLRRRLHQAMKRHWILPAPLNQSCLFLRLLAFPARRGERETWVTGGEAQGTMVREPFLRQKQKQTNVTRFIRIWNSPRGGSFDFRCPCKNSN